MNPDPRGESFLSGVIEGFYGRPWNQGERAELLENMARWGLNTYLYGPKDDLKHRALWREAYTDAEAEAFTQLIGRCRAAGVGFVYALAPGLDIRYAGDADGDRLFERCAQMMRLGCRRFALLFDDIPDRMDPEDLRRFGSLAQAQCGAANRLRERLLGQSPDAALMFCPTPYCGRMARRGLGGDGYLEAVGRQLAGEIDVFWTGPEIVSREITPAHVREMRAVLRRKPLIWDNLHANDYDGRRFFCGPYAGRSPEILAEVRGLLSNPNCEFPLNYVPLRSLAAFVRNPGPWDERASYLEAMGEWRAQFESVHGPTALEDLVSFGDCHYLPHRLGPEAEAFARLASRLVGSDPEAWAAGDLEAFRSTGARWRRFLGALPGIRRRPLFHALWRRMWDLREELDLVEKFVEFRSKPENRGGTFESDFHQPGTYRGGMVARLQSLLLARDDGSFEPSAAEAPAP